MLARHRDSRHATKTVPAALFDPCTLPDDALHSIGVDPETESPDFMGVQSEGWEVCGWEADWFYITVFVTDATVEEFRARPRTTDFRSVDLGNREASTFRSTADSQRGLCDLVYASSRGTVLIRAGAQGTELMRGGTGCARTRVHSCFAPPQPSTPPTSPSDQERHEPHTDIVHRTGEGSSGRSPVSGADAASTCAQACTDFLEVLNTLLIQTDRLCCKEAFGHLPSARALGQKFDDKAIGPGGFARFSSSTSTRSLV